MAPQKNAQVISLVERKRQIEIKDTIIDIRRVKGMISLHFANSIDTTTFYENYLIELKLSGKIIMPFTRLSEVPFFERPPSGDYIYVQLPYEELVGPIELTFRHAETGEMFKPRRTMSAR